MDDVELLSRLVAFDTVSHRSNLALVDFLCEYAAGARVERVPSPDGKKANLVLRFGPDEGEGLVLCGHMDVVPAEENGWRSDPFKLRAEGDRLFARGACDMKGFLAVATNLAMESKGLRRPLVLVYTGLAVGIALAVPVHGPLSGTELPEAQDVLDLWPARIVAIAANSLGTLAVVVVAATTMRRRPLGNALLLAGVAVAAVGSGLAGLGVGALAPAIALASVLLYLGMVVPRVGARPRP